MSVLLRLWQTQIEGLPGWQVHEHEGYRAVEVESLTRGIFFFACGAVCRPTVLVVEAGGGGFRTEAESTAGFRADAGF